LAQRGGRKISVMIGIRIQIQDRIFVFFTIARYGKKSLSTGLRKKLWMDLPKISRVG